MKYCAYFDADNKYFNEMDEYIIAFNGGRYKKLKEFLTIMQEEKRNITIFIPNTYFSINAFLGAELPHIYKVEIPLSFLEEPEYIQMFKDNNIPFFFCDIATSWDMLYNMAAIGVSDVIIGGELGFDLPNVSSFLHEKGIQIRCYPDIAQSEWNIKYGDTRPEDTLKQFFIRPEDVEIYEEYIDMFIFWHNQQELFYKIYNKDKKWFGNLGEIIEGLEDFEINSPTIIEQFGAARAICGRKCIRNGGKGCHICSNILETSKLLENKGLYFKY